MDILKRTLFMLSVVLVVGMMASCKDFLDEKPDISINVPQTLKDLRLMLDDAARVNQTAPGLIELGSDDYEVEYSVFISRPLFEQQVYLWEPNPIFQLADITQQWVKPYQTVLIANVVLESLDRIVEGTPHERDQLRGEALFIRAFAYYMLAQIYCDPFDPQGENSGPGIVIRPSSDFNEPSFRPTIAQVYQYILGDLESAYALLPESVVQKTRPGKQASLALLARVYLSMERYEQALNYADLALDYNDELIDFNTLSVTTSNPLRPMNEETVYYAFCNGASFITASRSNVVMDLYNQYENGDLRKTLCFNLKANGKYVFKASHSGSGVIIFTGLANDELYLIKAECLARIGNVYDACAVVNHYLQSRWKRGSYIDFHSPDKLKVLRFILTERRKGLLMRGLRWSDLRRLNRDDNFKTTLVRRFDDNELTNQLTPADSRYTYLIPDEIIQLTGLEQNNR